MISAWRGWLGCLLLLCSWVALADSAPAKPDSAKYSQGLLWRVDKPGQPASYIFGTIHTWNAGLADVLARTTPYLKSSSLIATELVLDEANAAQIARVMVMSGDQTLPDLLGANDYQRLLTLLEPRGMTDPMIRSLKPWAALTLLVTPNAEGGMPMDLQLTAMAKRFGKTVAGLETVREQIDVFEHMALADQLLMLRATLDQGGVLNQYLETLFDLYWAEDLAGLTRAAFEDWPADPKARAVNKQMLERLVYSRNRIMVTRLQSLMRGKSVFAAVGALHLEGERGVLSLLAARGYRVTRIED